MKIVQNDEDELNVGWQEKLSTKCFDLWIKIIGRKIGKIAPLTPTEVEKKTEVILK